MEGKVWARILAGLVLLAAIAGIAFFAFNAGAATHIQLPATANGNGQAPVPPYAYGHAYWRPFPFFFGFGCFGPLIALFLIFLAFRAFSFMLFGPRWFFWRRHGPWRHGWDEAGDVPPMFRDWHDRAHGQPPQSPDTKQM